MVSKKIFCLCLNEHHLQNLKKLDYIPVGLGANKFSEEWLKDNTQINISHKNPYYGEYTFYYWFWKNILSNLADGTWIGFAGYRYHWAQKNQLSSEEITKNINKENFQKFILKSIPEEWNNYNCVLGEQIFIDEWKLSKILKHGKKKFFLNPKNFLKKNQNIKLHFDIFHGNGNLDKAIACLDSTEQEDFNQYILHRKSFNRENLFFCKSNELMNKYFISVFNWLQKCEKIFGFDIDGYKYKRMYAFLAERYLGYWFNKYAKPLEWPIFFFDTNKNKINLK